MGCYRNIIYGPTADQTPLNTVSNAVIPTTGKPSLQITPVYGDDGIQIAYYEYHLKVDTVIYYQTSLNASIEQEVKRLKDILCTPGQVLVLYPVGLGRMPYINGTVTQAELGLPKLPPLSDVKGGPYPQNVVVEPLYTNDAINVSFTMMFRIKHGTSYLSNLLQYNSELDLKVDEDGDISFNFRATYESRQPIDIVRDLDPLAMQIEQDQTNSFPGMERKKHVSLTRDQRTAHIHIEFKEIKSDNAFFDSTRRVEATDEMSSQLMPGGTYSPGGFYKWNRRISATITLPPRVNKSWAWEVFKLILAERLRNLASLQKFPPIRDNSIPGSQAALEATTNNSTIKNWYLPLRIVLTNQLYSRTMSFTCEYLVCCDFETLITKSLICARVNTEYRNDAPTIPKSLSDQWKVWDDSLTLPDKPNTTPVEGLDFNSLAGNGKYKYSGPIVYMQCGSQPAANPTFWMSRKLPDEEDPDSTKPGNVTHPGITPDSGPPGDYIENLNQHNWVEYQNRFELIEDNDTIQVNYLQNNPKTYYQFSGSESSIPTRETEGLRLNEHTSDPDTGFLKPVVVSRGVSAFKIRMTGYAVRIGSKIPIPSVLSIGGALVTRTGQSRIKHQQIASGRLPTYLAQWDITYAVESNVYSTDISQQIKTSGTPSHFT